jgi:hypothetical protein
MIVRDQPWRRLYNCPHVTLGHRDCRSAGHRPHHDHAESSDAHSPNFHLFRTTRESGLHVCPEPSTTRLGYNRCCYDDHHNGVYNVGFAAPT